MNTCRTCDLDKTNGRCPICEPEWTEADEANAMRTEPFTDPALAELEPLPR
jgi:hypothetical protein